MDVQRGIKQVNGMQHFVLCFENNRLNYLQFIYRCMQ